VRARLPPLADSAGTRACRAAQTSYRLDLTRLSPTTLAPLGGPQRLPAGYSPRSISPDHRRLLLTKQSISRAGLAHPSAALRIADLASMRIGKPVSLGAGVLIDAAWASATRIVALTQPGPASYPFCCDEQLVSVDATSAAASAGQQVLTGGAFAGAAAYHDGFVILAAPPEADGFGPARLVIASANAPPRLVALDRIQAGYAPGGSDAIGTYQTAQLPGLALDAADNVAYVGGGDGLVARVDLQSGAVSYHQPQPTTSLFTLRSDTQGVSGRYRVALWLGAGRLLVGGFDLIPYTDQDGNASDHDLPIGTSIIDTTSWQQAPLATSADNAIVDGSILVSFRASAPGGSGGVQAYASDGRPLYTALRGHHVQDVESLGPRLVVYTGFEHLQRWIRDAGTGRVLSHHAVGRGLISLLAG
jgi:hypothetical protein